MRRSASPVVTPAPGALTSFGASSREETGLTGQSAYPARRGASGRGWWRDRLPRGFVLTGLSLLSVVAAGIHVGAAGDHFHESGLFALFFIVTGVAQASWPSFALDHPGPAVLGLGAGGNGAIVAVWVLSRTSGLPIGPHPWVGEPMGVADSLATVCEGLIVVGALVLLTGAAARPSRGGEGSVVRSLPPLLRLGFGLLVAGLVASAPLWGVDGGHHHKNAADSGLFFPHLVILAGIVLSLGGVLSAALGRNRHSDQETERRSR